MMSDLRERYPVVTLTGPRQSGKTTLCRMVFADLPYANLEDPDVRDFATSDPKAFLSHYPHGAVLDEFQRVPEITSFIQVIVDDPAFDGTFVLTGSRNLAIRNTVNQSLAGRTALACLLPFSCTELKSRWSRLSLDELIYWGGYPRLHDRQISPTQGLGDYVGTYVERDLRQLSLIRDLALFQKFLGLCAGRVGQILNIESLGNDTGISQSTARDWLTLLEASYIAFRLPPFFANISKRLIKSPKLYFYDVGLAAYLMGITDPSQLASHPLRGMLFENLVILEIMKYFLNRGPRQQLHFYRDSNGNEVDLVIPNGLTQIPVEIKAAQTIHRDFFKGLTRFRNAIPNATDPVLVYGGSEIRTQLGTQIVDLDHIEEMLSKLVT